METKEELYIKIVEYTKNNKDSDYEDKINILIKDIPRKAPFDMYKEHINIGDTVFWYDTFYPKEYQNTHALIEYEGAVVDIQTFPDTVYFVVFKDLFCGWILPYYLFKKRLYGNNILRHSE